MPALPTINVTDDQLARLLLVFKDAPGYQAWLIRQLKAAVIQHELAEIQERHRLELEAARAEITAYLNGSG